MRRSLLALILLVVSAWAQAEEIRYAIFELGKPGSQVPLFEGKRTYSLNEVSTTSIGYGRETHFRKELPIAGEFSIGASVFPGTDISGFGLWMKKRPASYEFWSDGGFSWEWFDRSSEFIYKKRQGTGSVRVAFRAKDNRYELSSVEFLEDATFRLNARPWFMFSHEDTHHMLIKAGSVLRLEP